MDPTPRDLRDLRRRLWASSEGALLASTVHPVHLIIDRATGRPVLPVPAAVLIDAQPVTLLLPGETDDALQVLGLPREVDPAAEAACDFYSAFFGRPTSPRWAMIDVELIKRLDVTVSAAEVIAPSPLRQCEGRLCRSINSSPQCLAAVCRHARAEFEHPMVVGVDSCGVMIRARFGVVRVDFDAEAPDEPAALAAIQRLAGEAP